MPAPDLIDTHCHLNFQRYHEDRGAVLQRAREAGISRIIVPAIDLNSAQEALDLAREQPGIYAAVGMHPNSSAAFADADISALRALAAAANVVAIGEIGLDYYWRKCPREAQQRSFETQLELAAQLELPVIIHNREAGADVLAILKEWAPSAPASLHGRLGVLHSFSGTADMAAQALELGFYLGFTGPLTFKKAEALRAIAQSAPLERLLLETDGPFLAPHPKRGKRNEPAYLPYINARLAALHGISAGEMAARSTQNAERLFALV